MHCPKSREVLTTPLLFLIAQQAWDPAGAASQAWDEEDEASTVEDVPEGPPAPPPTYKDFEVALGGSSGQVRVRLAESGGSDEVAILPAARIVAVRSGEAKRNQTARVGRARRA